MSNPSNTIVGANNISLVPPPTLVVAITNETLPTTVESAVPPTTPIEGSYVSNARDDLNSPTSISVEENTPSPPPPYNTPKITAYDTEYETVNNNILHSDEKENVESLKK